MENKYNDELLPESFEEMARAYSANLKKNGFIFIKLQEEEFNFLVDEILVLICKMKACLKSLNLRFDSKKLLACLCEHENIICQKFGNKKPHNLRCVANETNAFLSLVSCQNLLIIKLMSLAVKSGEFEFCNDFVVSVSGIFARSFQNEAFLPEN